MRKRTKRENPNLTYTSEKNGYTGVLYGNKSMSVFDRNEHEVMHTGFRNINTGDELKEFIDNFDEFLKDLKSSVKMGKRVN